MPAPSSNWFFLAVLFLGIGFLFPSCKNCDLSRNVGGISSVALFGGKSHHRAKRCVDSKEVLETCLQAEVVYEEDVASSPSRVEQAPTTEKSPVKFEDSAVTEALPESRLIAVDRELEIPVTPVKKLIEEPGGKAGRDIMVTAKEGDQIIVADDDNVTITGSGGIVMISGRCIKLDIKANQTEVYCDVVNEIEISGDNNSVTLGAVGKGLVSGSKNKVTWESGFGGADPEVKSTGVENELQKRPM